MSDEWQKPEAEYVIELRQLRAEVARLREVEFSLCGKVIKERDGLSAEVARLKKAYEPPEEPPMTPEEEVEFSAHMESILDTPEVKESIQKMVDHMKLKSERSKMVDDYPRLKLMVENYRTKLAKLVEWIDRGWDHNIPMDEARQALGEKE